MKAREYHKLEKSWYRARKKGVGINVKARCNICKKSVKDINEHNKDKHKKIFKGI
jgi:hypothetical protein